MAVIPDHSTWRWPYVICYLHGYLLAKFLWEFEPCCTALVGTFGSVTITLRTSPDMLQIRWQVEPCSRRRLLPSRLSFLILVSMLPGNSSLLADVAKRLLNHRFVGDCRVSKRNGLIFYSWSLALK
jgi:hypothetical protein